MTQIITTSLARKAPKTDVELRDHGKLLVIRKGRKEEEYDIAEIGTRWDGRAFDLTKKSDGSTYQVFCGFNRQDHTCDCLGHEHMGFCKHSDSLYYLLENGLLTVPEADVAVQSDPVPCQECGAPVDDPFSVLCDGCSKPVRRDPVKETPQCCESCGVSLDDGDLFCLRCSESLFEQSAGMGKQRITGKISRREAEFA